MASDADPILPLRCPKCDHDEARLSVRSETVLTVKCLQCKHSWSTDILTLRESIRTRLLPLLERTFPDM